jgi:hypothetical protein
VSVGVGRKSGRRDIAPSMCAVFGTLTSSSEPFLRISGSGRR